MINMAVAAYTITFERIPNKKATQKLEILKQHLQKLAVREFFLSATLNVYNLFIHPVEEAPSLEEVRKVLSKIFDEKSISTADIQVLSDQNAINYFFKYANSLTGQTRVNIFQSFSDDFNRAKKAETIGPVFQRLFQRSIWLHEKVRMNTNYFNYTTDPFRIFSELAEKIFDAPAKISIQITGFDENVIPYLKNLYQSGCRRFLFDGNDAEFSQITNRLEFSNFITRGNGILSRDSDILISCTEETSIVSENDLTTRMANKSNAPLLILSIMPNQTIQNLAGKSYNVYCYTTFDLENIISKNNDHRSKILDEIEPWIKREVEDFYMWLSGKERFQFQNIVGQSKRMQELFELISRISQTDISVLIQGDSGTGKELVAKAIHNLSSRADNAFIAVNCGAIPENLIESELFGHVRGSFTGAVSNKNGLLQEANHGTIILDEIAELPQHLQVKLLRFLQEGDLKPVGSNETKKVDVRVLAATNKNLLEMVKQGQFRSDLLYRLNVILLELPSLMERSEDIPLLAEYFVNKYATKFNKEVRQVSEEAMSSLISYSWPGNVRELENAIEHAVALSLGEQIMMYDLPESIKNEGQEKRLSNLSNNKNGYTKLKDIERLHITSILDQTSWDYEKACSLLGIGRTTLWRKIKEYNISQ